jgi:DNA-binding NarL/FixJ family response regulator
MSSEISKPAAAGRRRVFLVDDHPLVREGLVNLIERQPDLSVCGQAETAAAAFDAISRAVPDLALVDLSLEASSGLELIKQLQALPAPPPVLVLSMHDETLYAERALRAGARGYIMKRSAPRYVIEAIRQVIDGKLYMSEALAARMAERYVGAKAVPGESPIALLSDRELEVFQKLGEGWETRRIAKELHLSPKTVQVYCGRIKEKFSLANATELIREAVRWAENENRG